MKKNIKSKTFLLAISFVFIECSLLIMFAIPLFAQKDAGGPPEAETSVPDETINEPEEEPIATDEDLVPEEESSQPEDKIPPGQNKKDTTPPGQDDDFVPPGQDDGTTPPGQEDKDKTPPVISELSVDSITDISAIVRWTTDEPADSDIKYGIDPLTNTNGPIDSELVISHAIALSGLVPETTYAFCVTSKDARNNKTDSCDTFMTLTQDTPPEPPPPQSSGGGGGGGRSGGNSIAIRGFASPDAQVVATFRTLPFGKIRESETIAKKDGSFAVTFDDFPRGLYLFSANAVDRNGLSSVRKSFQFDIARFNTSLSKDVVLIPPTITFARDVISWGDNLLVSGATTPNIGVLVDVGGVSYETKSDEFGDYKILINTARLTPGKVSLRARSSIISEFGYDYSQSKTVTLTITGIPQADLNADGVVDIKDASIFLFKPVDINNDGKTDITDMSIFLRALSQN